ncbi:hypothetical protein [Numidum massiliense]|uniref:hypothetical protein n=1 Tax=Numidum massiliense TaxID=1522315 RepID=UPI0006D55CF3|nr:hypothetical protein [Numidum massiliense]
MTADLTEAIEQLQNRVYNLQRRCSEQQEQLLKLQQSEQYLQQRLLFFEQLILLEYLELLELWKQKLLQRESQQRPLH